MGKNRFLGRTSVSDMSVGQMCQIRIRRKNIDILSGPTYEDFGEEWYRGEVSEMGDSRLSPQPVRAFFADERIEEHKEKKIRNLAGQEPPFEYEVRPLYRMQGLTTYGEFCVGDICVIYIGDFDIHPTLCLNHGMPTFEILRLFPAESFKGFWRGRVIQVSTSLYETDGMMCHPIAVVLEDVQLLKHPPSIKDWYGHEPPVKYHVHPQDVRTRATMLGRQGLNLLMEKIRDVKKNGLVR